MTTPQPEPIRVYNATRHWQKPQVWERHGVIFLPAPAPGVNNLPPNATPEDMMLEVAETMRKIDRMEEDVDVVLIGGVVGLAMLIGVRAHIQGFVVAEAAVAGKNKHGEFRITGLRFLSESIDEILNLEGE